MRVEECGAARGERVDVRRLRERMAAKRADPVVLIVDGDKDCVGSRARLSGGERIRQTQGEKGAERKGKKETESGVALPRSYFFAGVRVRLAIVPTP